MGIIIYKALEIKDGWIDYHYYMHLYLYVYTYIYIILIIYTHVINHKWDLWKTIDDLLI